MVKNSPTTERDWFSLEEQARLAAEGIKVKGKRSAILARRYAKSLDELRKYEAALVRAFHKFDKARSTERRLAKQIAKLQGIES